MGKTRDSSRKIGDIKGTFHARVGTINDRNGKDLTEAEETKKRSLIPKMSMFTLAISSLTTSNLPSFMDLTFQLPIQYCSLQLQTLLLSSVTYTTGCCFCFGSVSSFFLELFSPLFSSSVVGTYWHGEFIFQCHTFCIFILFMGFSRKEYWSGLPFPSPVDHIL